MADDRLTAKTLAEWRRSAASIAAPGRGRSLSRPAQAIVAERVIALCDEIAALTEETQRLTRELGEATVAHVEAVSSTVDLAVVARDHWKERAEAAEAQRDALAGALTDAVEYGGHCHWCAMIRDGHSVQFQTGWPCNCGWDDLVKRVAALAPPAPPPRESPQ